MFDGNRYRRRRRDFFRFLAWFRWYFSVFIRCRLYTYQFVKLRRLKMSSGLFPVIASSPPQDLIDFCRNWASSSPSVVVFDISVFLGCHGAYLHCKTQRNRWCLGWIRFAGTDRRRRKFFRIRSTPPCSYWPECNPTWNLVSILGNPNPLLQTAFEFYFKNKFKNKFINLNKLISYLIIIYLFI